jgi:hypothetical protein
MIEFLIGGIVGYLLGGSDSTHTHSTSYEVEDRYIGVVYYNKKTGKLIYFCPSCGGVGKKEYYDSSFPYTWTCKACNGKKVLTLIVPEDIRKEIIKKVKAEKRKYAKKHKKN